MERTIYLDNNSTTQLLPEVVEAMLPFLQADYANPSSLHPPGQAVRHRVECAREQVAALIGASPKEMIFTSCGTESINLAVRGLIRSRLGKRRWVTTAVEHSAVLALADQLAAEDMIVDHVGVDHEGRLDEAEWASRLTDDVALASIMHANNETGVVFDIARLAGIAADRGIPVHVDAVQSAGKLPIDVSSWPVSLVSLSAHKFHGPKGVGALYIRKRTPLEPMIVGGGQERRLRGGTENVVGIIGLGVAAEAAGRECNETTRHVGSLRDLLEKGILKAVPFARVNGSGAERIYNTSNISFEGLESEAILILLGEAGVCASAGSACSSGSLEPSHVLKAMDIEPGFAHGAIRFSLSRFNTVEEVYQTLELLPALLSRLTVLSR